MFPNAIFVNTCTFGRGVFRNMNYTCTMNMIVAGGLSLIPRGGDHVAVYCPIRCPGVFSLERFITYRPGVGGS